MAEKITKDDLDRAFKVASILQQRSSIAGALGQSFGGDRDLYAQLGYPKDISFDKYLAMYRRQDIAKRIVDLPAQDTWRDVPEVRDLLPTEEQHEVKDTEFLKGWQALSRRLRVHHYFERVDRLAGIGEYAVLLIGMKGGENLSDEVKEGELKSPDDVLFLAAYDEGSADIEEYETDPANPRFNLPRFYNIDTGESSDAALGGTKKVHWSRVIHVAEDLLENEVKGTPRLEAVFNRLQDLEKVVGAGAEAMWRLIYKGIVLTAKEGFELPKDEITESKVEEFVHGMRRILELEGVEAKFEGGEVVDPSGMVDVIIALIAAETGIPQRILTGSERGELASSTDQSTWAGAIASRRESYAEPTILRQFIDRMILLGALQEAENEDGYSVEWEPLFEMSAKEEAETASKAADALQKLAPPGLVDLIIDPTKFVEVYLPRLSGATRDMAGEVEREMEESPETPESVQFLTEVQQRERELAGR